ncbi:NAD(P)/FAD-dependent oxidoreductase [Calothrix sp. 336/3]|uniref:NAD(P)/FAD-dependent oxidoreductase n=1 Tax=Calothrix sp. 336/3 TaxID=1337936 RepID=UPI0004E407E2|nr:FAD-dependent oxidoreductase [Calothrix sp. 336/3]AKG22156.1 FAD-dependent oxidoreductase [Calothrix sp. 336/3]
MNIAIIGCGVIGAAIAYELSQVPGLNITVFDRQPPAQASTGAALGVLMGIISHKVKGKAWQLRQTSIQRYLTLIPELEAITGRLIPRNSQGILLLLTKTPEADEISQWDKLVTIRQQQNWQLEIFDTDKLAHLCPQVATDNLIGAVYSPQDMQIDPTALTLALVDGAKYHGVNFQFGVDVIGMKSHPQSQGIICQEIETSRGKITADKFIITAGLGSTLLTAQLNQMVDIRPVLGQALHLQLSESMGNLDFQPVITGDDVHIVPQGKGEYWVGATVEFPTEAPEISANRELLQQVRERAIAFCPQLSTATILRTWSGLRPRPEGRPAPIIEPLSGYQNVLLATGHYRNGVLLAPATAYTIREMINFAAT